VGERVREGATLKLRRSTLNMLKALKAMIQSEFPEFNLTYSDLVEAMVKTIRLEEVKRELVRMWESRRGTRFTIENLTIYGGDECL